MTDGSSTEISFTTLNPFLEGEKIEEIWNNLEKRSVHSYFNSWGWLSVWLLSLPANSKITLHVGYQNQLPVVAFFLGERRSRKYGFLPHVSFALNTTASSYYDSLYIEYNSILYDSSTTLNLKDIINYILSLGWDELILPGISHKFASDFHLIEKEERPFHVLMEHDTSSFYVDLQKIRDDSMNFMQLLSSNRRSQLRRSLKQYEANGKIHMQEAQSTEEALDLYSKLVQQHQLEWKKRGLAGAFANRFLYQFHKNLIERRFAKGEIQILHIYTDEMEIGYIYSFVYDKEILFYQSGFNYQTNNNNYRPGLVSHYLAVLHNAQKDMKTYDFLAGDSSYKRTLATDSMPIYWINLYKSKWRYKLEATILQIKTKIKSNSFLLTPVKKLATLFLMGEQH